MMELTLRALMALSLLIGTTAAPAMAVVDDGKGCGCTRPCLPKDLQAVDPPDPVS